MFYAHHTNPALGTLAEIAAALGLRITLEPLPAAESKVLTEPLLKGRSTTRRHSCAV